MTVSQIFGLDQSVIGETNFELGFGSLLEGVCLDYSDECRVYTPLAMDAVVRPGLLCVGGVFVEVTAFEVLLINAGGVLPRYDRVVVRRDNNTNAVWIGIKEGTPAAAPVPPALTRAGGIYEISLARILVRAGAAIISFEDIRDERGEPSLCGYISFRAYEQVQRAAVEGWRQRGRWSAYANAAAPAWQSGEGLYEINRVVHNAGAVVLDADGVALQQDTNAALLNDDAYVVFGTDSAGANLHRGSYRYVFECKFKLGQLTDERVAIGLGSVVAWGVGTGSDSPVGSHAALVYSTSVPDTNFMFVVKDTVTQERFDSGVPADTAAHIIRIEATPSNPILFTLMDSFRNIQAQYLAGNHKPAGATGLYASSAIRTLTAVASKTIYQYYASGINRNIE